MNNCHLLSVCMEQLSAKIRHVKIPTRAENRGPRDFTSLPMRFLYVLNNES